MYTQRLGRLKKADIKKLNELGYLIGGVIMRIPTILEQKEAQAILKRKKFTKACWINQYYARNVLMACEYAMTHFHRETGMCLLDDVVRLGADKININDYYGI